ncbi:Phosphatidylethanolamine N-methyltransferase [Erysiphe neolycopersici]|uniref:Phosphatidylethanolamine N-methyltransferase n=1 Tax=Erysiphe neolycopersici TaxID=212602 RepID=A0A420HFC0_9PEZI|nr:Phosphatidylethanolamine N-methyltransferase [Erysiphe neolycopersici]
MTIQAAEEPGIDGIQRRRVGIGENHNKLDSSQLLNDQSTVVEGEQVRHKKTYGRTPDGTIFIVPQTHDMVSQLLDPRQPKNLSDALVIAIIALHILLYYFLPSSLKQLFTAVVFLFWRTCYNLGVGYLLQIQSNYRRLVQWAKKIGLFEGPRAKTYKKSWIIKLIKRELEAKIPDDYQFEKAPIEYNTWLLFRRLVDLILMCDFTSYCLFAISCGHHPIGEELPLSLARWTVGILLVGFNLWVKLDAHRVVKDYAWYWGDFFYMIDQKLTFDGVFEMAPHPMYSVGYAGYYGISMMAASYKVFFISIIAHTAQFLFLIYVETPHIEKTYNPPSSRKLETDSRKFDLNTVNLAASEEGKLIENESYIGEKYLNSFIKPISVHNYLGFGNFDIFRTADVSVLLLQALMALLTLLTPSTKSYQVIFCLAAIFWRIWFTVGLGAVLDRQSKVKLWTRHFVKFGETPEVAWREWKGIYYLSMTMCYTSFIAASWKMYSIPPDWTYGLVLFRHVLGVGLIVLQIWTAMSIYDTLGEFGWFFGDFFFEKDTKLTYSGIYRYLNNPERILGLTSIWGAVLITSSPAIFFLALISHILSLGFIQLVEKPHMHKLYGRKLRAEAGLSKSIRRSLPPPLKKIQGSFDKVFEESGQFVTEFLDAAQPKFAAGISTIARDTSSLFNQYSARLTLTRLAPDLAGYDPQDYSLQISGESLMTGLNERVTGKECVTGRFRQSRTDQYEPLIFDYGAPISVKWKAPAYCRKNDWIGLYMVADNASREVTRVSSAGRWMPTFPENFEDLSQEKQFVTSHKIIQDKRQSDGTSQDYFTGEVIFRGDKLWWTQGVFEFRYHHDGKHNVMAISLPFEISIRKFDDKHLEISDTSLIRSATENSLLSVVRNCFDRDTEIAPSTVDESFGSIIEREGKYAKRVVYAIHQMFGLELAPKVVLADGNIRKLAWRIFVAKQALAPFSMSHSEGTTTPISSD